MSSLNWGQAAGFLGKLLDRMTDPHKKIQRELRELEKEADEIGRNLRAGSHSAVLARRLDRVIARISELRQERARLPKD